MVAVESSHEQTEVDFTCPDFIGPERFNSGFERQGRIPIASQNSCIKIYQLSDVAFDRVLQLPCSKGSVFCNKSRL